MESKSSGEAISLAQDAHRAKSFEYVAERMEAVVRGDVITVYDPTKVEKGVCTDMTHYVKNEQGKLIEITQEEANKKAKGHEPEKLETKSIGQGLLGIKGKDGVPMVVDIANGRTSLSLEDAQKKAVEIRTLHNAEIKAERMEAVVRGDVITVYDPTKVGKGVCTDMTHYVKNEQGELIKITQEEANKKAKGHKAEKLETKSIGQGLLGIKGKDGVPMVVDLAPQRGNNQTNINNNIRQTLLTGGRE